MVTKRRSKQQEYENEHKKVKYVSAKTDNQKNYIRAIVENDIIFCTGPSGSGKSFIASGISAEHLHHNKIETILVTRPLVCTGKSIGSLPGELLEKIDPYLTPMQEHLKFFLGRAHYGQYSVDERIKYFPLEMMRGCTFDETYMLLDEAQNCTYDQIQMFITRMGEGSKVIINGDVKQSDINSHSGLPDVIEKLDNLTGVAICRLGYHDIQRHGLLGSVLRRLEE
jgi:phosphate starvation-inducible PhoH-like protein